jgi:hypothetical protein
MDKSLAAHYYKLSAGQGHADTQARGESILEELGDPDAQ